MTAGPFAVGAFYRFAPVADVAGLAAAVEVACAAQDLKGTVLIAPEGVNGALAGSRAAIEAAAGLALSAAFPGLRIHYSPTPSPRAAFRRLKVRAKAEIVTFGESLVGQPVGEHVDAPTWNALLADPAVRVVDVRNGYESAIGAFPGATTLRTANFGEFREAVRAGCCGDGQAPVAMYCTGGIRCEKASAHLLAQGFGEVYQLDGGILGYLDTCQGPRDEPGPVAARPENRFAGACFVFDDRVALAADLGAGGYRMCGACRVVPTNAAHGTCHVCDGTAAPQIPARPADPASRPTRLP